MNKTLDIDLSRLADKGNWVIPIHLTCSTPTFRIGGEYSIDVR
jgi:hypothetical protein